MKYDHTVFQDGQFYAAGEEVPDMGSLVCVDCREGEKGYIRSYEGLSKDADKLPKYKNLSTGSSFYALDTGEYQKYEMTTKEWIPQ